MRQGVKIDGEYYLKVKSRILQVRLSCQDCSIMTQPTAPPQALMCCLNVFGLRFTVLRCRLISPRSM